MLTEEQAANAYEEVTDGCRRLVRVTSDNAPQWQRVKPDEELHPLAELDYEGGRRGIITVPHATPLRASTSA